MGLKRSLRRKRNRERDAQAQERINIAPTPDWKPAQIPMRVVIASPMMDMCHTSFASALLHMFAHTYQEAPKLGMGFEMTFLQYGTSMLPLSRQFLAVKALEIKASHMLWIDSDMEFPPDMMIRLARHGKPIVAANCIARRPPFNLTARDDQNEQVFTTPESTGLEKVARIGFGVVWTDTEVFRRIPMPWFEYEWIPEMGIFRGEDFVFCSKAREAGFELMIDHDISKQVNHVGMYGFNPLMRAQEVPKP